MAQGTANLRAIPGVLAEALQATLALNPSSEGQKTAQRDIATALETAFDGRRQRTVYDWSPDHGASWQTGHCTFSAVMTPTRGAMPWLPSDQAWRILQ